MGLIERGDEPLHYSDCSHRWIAPPDIDQKIWEATVQAHVARHSGGAERARRSPRDGTIPPVTGGAPDPPRH
jgi:hypothetical protein